MTESNQIGFFEFDTTEDRVGDLTRVWDIFCTFSQCSWHCCKTKVKCWYVRVTCLSLQVDTKSDGGCSCMLI